jgi:hypothetical protein
MIILGVLLAVVLVAAFFVRRVLRRGQNIVQLAQNGTEAVATITETLTQRRSRVEDYYFVNYTFRASDGNEYNRKFRVGELESSDYEKGMSIDVVYLPADPAVNALHSTVLRMRETLSESQ